MFPSLAPNFSFDQDNQDLDDSLLQNAPLPALTGTVDQDIGGFGQGEFFNQASGGAIQEEDLEDFGQGLFDLGGGQGANKENQPPPSADPRPRRREPSRNPRDEDDADCRPPSQKDTFSRARHLKIAQRRERQTPSPKQQGLHEPAPAFVSPSESVMPTTTRRKAQVGNTNDENTTTPTVGNEESSQPSPEFSPPGLEKASSEETDVTTPSEDTNTSPMNDDDDKEPQAQGASDSSKGSSGPSKGASAQTFYVGTKRHALPEKLPEALVAYTSTMNEERDSIIKRMKKCNAQERMRYITLLTEEAIGMRVEVAFLNLELNKVSDGQDKDEIMHLTEANAKKDKKIAALEKQVLELEALARATKGIINKELAEEVTNWAKEDGWRSQKFLTSSAEVRKFAKECTKKLPVVKDFHGDEDQEAVFFLTYGKALSKGISGRRTYLTQELKKLFFELKKSGIKPYTHEELLRCAKRNISFDVSPHMFCAMGQTFCG